jgi:hypothetical protein
VLTLWLTLPLRALLLHSDRMSSKARHSNASCSGGRWNGEGRGGTPPPPPPFARQGQQQRRDSQMRSWLLLHLPHPAAGWKSLQRVE